MTVSLSPVRRAAPASSRFRPDPALRRAILLTLLTLVGLLAGLAGEHLLAPAALGGLGYGLAYLAGGVPAAREALQTLLRERKLDVDLLMVLAALGAASIGQAADGAALLFLFSLSNTLQDWAMGRTKSAITALMTLHPTGATVRRNGAEHWCPLSEIRAGDLLVLKPGERVAADARVVRGQTSVDESPITGESVPVDKGPGSELASGTVNLNGSVEAEVLRPAGESTLARLVRLLEEAQTQKSRTERLTERWESPYATLVLLAVPLVFLLLRLAYGLPAGEAWSRAMTLMVVASPCAVVISTPAVMLSAMAAAARAGVLFKSSAALDALASVRTVAFDKTGTLTQARMTVTAVHAEDERATLALAAGLEAHSEHPIARAIVTAAAERAVGLRPVQEAQAVPGYGIVARTPEGERAWAGNRRLAEREGATLDPTQEAALRSLAARGSSSVIVGLGARVLGVIGVADALRPESRDAIARLRASGVPHLVMLTGDRHEIAEAVAREVGVAEVHSELLPQDKLRLVGELPAPVAMVGDGVNDAPALARADLGVAVASGTDVALESADVVLMHNDLGKLAGAVRLAREARRTVLLNLTFAFSVMLLVAPLAVTGQVPLPLGVLAHEGGTVFVVFMGLRLLRRRV